MSRKQKVGGRWSIGMVRCSIACMLLAAPAVALAAPEEEMLLNNLSFPVLWAEDFAKPLPGTEDMPPKLTGEWWYWWGTDLDGTPLSCPPDSDDPNVCDDGTNPGAGSIRAYLQKDANNTWQAGHEDMSEGGVVNVDWVDWGDNLESQDWYINSKVRTEVVLYKDLDDPMLEYGMRHLAGLGTDEIHGIATHGNPPVAEKVTYNNGVAPQATVYSNCARLTIQRLLVERDSTALDNLTWDVRDKKWVGAGLVKDPIFNKSVHDGETGPDGYSAEINVKGKVIYGYTWNVRDLYDKVDSSAVGDYRITFSFDDENKVEDMDDDKVCPQPLNTFFSSETGILLPLETSASATTETDESTTEEGGGEATIKSENNLTYIDVRILNPSRGRK